MEALPPRLDIFVIERSRPQELPTSLGGSRLIPETEWGSIERSLRLTSRERQIVRRVFDNQTEDGIAYDLGVSKNTVHTQVRRLYRKLRVTTRVELVLFVFSKYLVRDDGRSERPSPVRQATHLSNRGGI